jgi:ribosomal protein L37AE/L43A
VDFSLERARALKPDREDEEYLLEIAFLYDRIVQSGSKVPVIDLAYELVLPLEFIGECVCNAMEIDFLSGPKRGSFGGRLTPRALKIINPDRLRRKQLRALSCPKCGTKGLKRILYGMPGDDFEFGKYIAGGCIMSEADIGCSECDWSGIWDEMK